MITTIIEKYLSSVDQATFQKMMNHLLHLEGYKFICSPGSVIGKNKTSKGGPDSFFEDGDNYIFCEYTTQEKLSTGETFFKKLKKDVAHCFDKSATGIDNSKISRVLLAFTEKLQANEHNELKADVKTYNPNAELIIYSIQEIPFRLVYYPGLADKYIPGVKTTTGTLYTLPDFLKITEKGLQPSLTNPFSGREEEIKQAKEFLLTTDILIIAGSQGVGKSKLAVQLAEIFESEYKYEPRVIASSPVPLWDDLTSFILPDKKYFIFFDDANKSLPNLDYLLQFSNSREKGSIKIVITVRDYVQKDINKFIVNYPHNGMTIKPLNSKQIKDIILESLPAGKMLDDLVIEKVISLSKGNSRLALMAVSSILQNNDIRILNDVFSLYDQYFWKVKSDLTFLEKPENLKALGILSFFGVLDRNDNVIKETLEKHFNVNWTELWETFLELERVELVDVFYKETAKISDQVLSTYVFYKTFIDENFALINYSDWIVLFIGKYESKINKTLIDMVNTFGFLNLKDRITSLITDVQKKIETDVIRLYKFYQIFWFYKEMDTLLFVRDWIDSYEEENVELADIKYTYEVNEFVWAPEYLKLLINFWRNNTPFTRDAIELGLKLMFKHPSKIPEVLKHLSGNISFHRYDYRGRYQKQLTLIETLNNKDFSIRETAISEQIFLSIAPLFLDWEYHQTEDSGDGQITMYTFRLVKSSSLMELRKKILERLFVLFNRNEDKVLDVMLKYSRISRSFDPRVLTEEQPIVTPFFNNNLKPENYSHCKVVYEYVDTLREYNITLLNDWSLFLDSDSMHIAKVFSSNYNEERLGYVERELKRKSDIENLVVGKDINFIKTTFRQVNSIYSDAARNRDTYLIDSSLGFFFQALADTIIILYYKSLELIMLGNYSFELAHGSIIFYPVKKKLVQPKELYNHLNRYEYKQKQYWKQMFFDAIEDNEIDEFILQEFIGFIFSVNNKFYFYDLDGYIKFNRQFVISQSLLPPSAANHKNILTYIIEILLSKTTTVDINFDRQICEKCSIYFIDNLSLLKKVYFLNNNRDAHYDYEGKEMAAISNLDHYFLMEFLTEITKDVLYIDFKFERLKITFILDFPEYEDIFDKALEIIIAKAPIFSSFEHQANVLFKGLKLEGKELEKIYGFISKFIAKHYSSQQHIHIILNVVTYSFNDQVLRFLKEFLLLNKDVEFIKNLWLERNNVITGSRVPEIESEITFKKKIIEMIKTLPHPLDYTNHVKLLEQEVEWGRKEKQEEMKRDFSGWMG